MRSGRARALVQRSDQDGGSHAPLMIVVGRLQQQRGFAGIHRRVTEIELCHARYLSVQRVEGNRRAHFSVTIPPKSTG